ncbi:MAG: hypothetical protein JW782_03420 [Candidatus Saganbacteria bacterium]|nr:hypothetical protein [Candidatus Saganbacteria bacterium]
MSFLWIRLLFAFVGCVEFVTGLSFIFLTEQVFAWTGIARITHLEYIQFPALLIMVFGLMMFAVARDPRANRRLIPYISFFKVALIGVVLYNWLTKGLSWLWLSFMWFDIVYLIGFVSAYLTLKDTGS